jgi:uridine kinase
MKETHHSKQAYVIGIAGGTGSGKTTVASELVAVFPKDDVVYLSFDHYYRDLSHLPPSERKLTNFDHPNSLESDLFVTHVEDLKNNIPIDRPTYDFVTHTRTDKTIRLDPAPIIVVEGILTFVYPKLRELLDIKIFVDTEADVRFIRRLDRDIKERGRTVDSVVTQYMKTVRPMHIEFVEPSKRFADIIIPEGRNDVALHVLITTIRQQIRSYSSG